MIASIFFILAVLQRSGLSGAKHETCQAIRHCEIGFSRFLCVEMRQPAEELKPHARRILPKISSFAQDVVKT
jgi:hypothetical protein